MKIDCLANLRGIRDQEMRGTCVAFATSAAHEHSRAVRRGPLADDLSVEHLFWRCKQLDNNTTDGTSFVSTRDALADPGQCDEALWPYEPVRDLTTPYDPPGAVTCLSSAARATLTRITADEASVVAVLATRVPVIAGLQLWGGFYDCDSVVIPAPAGDIDPTALHAVCFTGVDQGGNTVMVRNSWGLGWGQDGYAWLELSALPQVLLEAWTIADDIDHLAAA